MVVVGGGISGLAAAHRLSLDALPIDITVVEKSATVGGKLRLHDVAGMQLDAGAESMLARRPEGVDLCNSVDLGDDVRHPATEGAGVWVDGTLWPLPKHQVMGIPYSMPALEASGVLGEAARVRVAQDTTSPATVIEGDVSVGSLVGDRMGQEVVDRLVEPLLGGVYAGQASQISTDMAIPGLLDELESQPSLMAAVEHLASRGRTGRPVFASTRGGLGRLPKAVADASGARLLLSSEAVELERSNRGWFLRVSTAGGQSSVEADAVLLAVDAPAAGRLLVGVNPTAADVVGGVEYASVALVTFVFDAATPLDWPAGTGFLVPASEGLMMKAATFTSQKWAWIADAYPERSVVRASVGRFGDETALDMADDELASHVLSELEVVTGVTAKPVASVVSRWPRSLPQYRVGHRARVADVRGMLDGVGALELCGAGLDGVGVPACIASGQQAATRVADSLRQTGQWNGD